jgi:ketosteroid isomerase-like protein
MSRSTFVLALAGVLALGGVFALQARGGPAPAATPEQMIQASKQLDQEFLAAFNKGDMDALMATYWKSPDLVVYPPDSLEALGWEAAKKAMGGLKGMKLELVSSHYRVFGDAVLGWGRWKLSGTGPDGSPINAEGRYTDVRELKDGRWVYTLDHASAPLPPPSK